VIANEFLATIGISGNSKPDPTTPDGMFATGYQYRRFRLDDALLSRLAARRSARNTM
jgi:hypothetical protein